MDGAVAVQLCGSMVLPELPSGSFEQHSKFIPSAEKVHREDNIVSHVSGIGRLVVLHRFSAQCVTSFRKASSLCHIMIELNFQACYNSCNSRKSLGVIPTAEI